MGALAITKSKLRNLGKVSTKGVQKHPLCVCFSENDDSVKAVFFICVKVTAAHCIVNKKYHCMVEFPHINDKQRSGWGDAGGKFIPAASHAQVRARPDVEGAVFELASSSGVRRGREGGRSGEAQGVRAF